MPSEPMFSPWPHRHRAWLAELYLHTLFASRERACTLTGPRGCGKTAFAKHDLLPFASTHGIDTHYVSFGKASTGAPYASTGDGTSMTTAGKPVPASTTSILLGSLGHREPHGSTVDRVLDQAPFAGLSHVIGALSECLAAAPRRAILIVFDDVEHLSAGEWMTLASFLSVQSAMRASPTWRVFMTSSRLPWQSSGTLPSSVDTLGRIESLPHLGEDFLHAAAQWVASRANGHDMPIEALRTTWSAVGRSPQLFRDTVTRLTCGDAPSLAAAERDVRRWAIARHYTESGLGRLSDLQAAVLRAVWRSGAELYVADRRAAYAHAIGVEHVSKTEVQGAIKRLERLAFVHRDPSGRYVLNSTSIDALFGLDAIERHDQARLLALSARHERDARLATANVPAPTTASEDIRSGMSRPHLALVR